MKLLRKLLYYLQAARLPLVLAVVFAAQNQIFNLWLGIVPHLYLVRGSLVTFALGMLLYGPAVFFGKRARYWYLLPVSIIVSLIFTSEYLYYSHYRAFLQANAFKMFRESLAVGGAIAELLTPKILLFLINIPIVIGAAWLAYRDKLRPTVLIKLEKVAAGFLIMIILAGGYGWLMHTEKRDWGNTTQLYSNLWDLNMLVGKMGIVNFFIEDAIKLALHANAASPQDKNFASNWLSNRRSTVNPKASFGIAKGRNLIFIQVESLEKAVINKKVGEQEITPNLNALSSAGFYFPNYFTQVSEGNTADAEFVILNSLYPLPGEVAFIDYAQNTYQALPKLLTENNYHTYSFHGDVPTFWNRSNIYPNLGYQTYFTKKDFTISRPVGFQDLGDEDFFTQSFDKLQNLPQPFMATLITLTSHPPFDLPQDLQTLALPADTNLNEEQKKYLQSVHYTDQAIGNFIEKIKGADLYNNSLIVITGDHGSYTKISKKLLQNEGLLDKFKDSEVPMMLIAPGTKLKGVNNAVMSHLDLYPTLANLLGVTPPAYALGKDILNTSEPVVVRREPITGSIKAIISSKLFYLAGTQGIFENGRCLNITNSQPLPIADCRSLYNRQAAKIKVSDTLVKGNMISSAD